MCLCSSGLKNANRKPNLTGLTKSGWNLYLTLLMKMLLLICGDTSYGGNTLYKLVHDARLNLKKKMEAKGIDPEKMLKEL
jgi:hypothetical protein